MFKSLFFSFELHVHVLLPITLVATFLIHKSALCVKINIYLKYVINDYFCHQIFFNMTYSNFMIYCVHIFYCVYTGIHTRIRENIVSQFLSFFLTKFIAIILYLKITLSRIYFGTLYEVWIRF